MELSIVIPVFRSAASIRKLYDGISAAVSGDIGIEIIFVEDCGGDDSWSEICQLASADDRVRGLKLTRNFGQHYAITAGLEVSVGSFVVTMDCDLQDDPAYLRVLLDRAKQGFDIVLVRRTGRDDGWLNNQSSKLFYRVFDLLTGAKTDPAVGAYRVMSRRVVEQYCALPERQRFFGGLIQWMGYPTSTIDVPRRARHVGKSSYNLYKRFALALDAVLSFSDRPLKLMVFAGALTAFAATFYAAIIIFQRLAGQIGEIGFASIIVSLYLLSGLLLMCIGLVGVYIGRIYNEVKRRPCFLIAEDTSAT